MQEARTRRAVPAASSVDTASGDRHPSRGFTRKAWARSDGLFRCPPSGRRREHHVRRVLRTPRARTWGRPASSLETGPCALLRRYARAPEASAVRPPARPGPATTPAPAVARPAAVAAWTATTSVAQAVLCAGGVVPSVGALPPGGPQRGRRCEARACHGVCTVASGSGRASTLLSAAHQQLHALFGVDYILRGVSYLLPRRDRYSERRGGCLPVFLRGCARTVALNTRWPRRS